MRLSGKDHDGCYSNFTSYQPFIYPPNIQHLKFTCLPRSSITSPQHSILFIKRELQLKPPLSPRLSELYGPLMVVLTLIAVMLAGMKSSGQTVQEGTLMGTAIGTCFGYWLGASLFFFGLAYFCDTRLSPIEVCDKLLFAPCMVIFYTIQIQ